MSEPGILPNPIPFGKYYLLERINVGGMAEVYKAKAFGVEGFERLLAVKKILAAIAEDEAFINMFIDEAKIAGQLNHPNIAQIFDLGKVDGSYFIALEYIGGKDLKTIFERSRRIGEKVSIPRVSYTIMKVCEGLAHAHHKKDTHGKDLNIVHRDISPQNVLMSYEGEVKVIDFGIAKAQGKTSQTQVGILKGKFSYMSPEQVRGLHVDHRSDLFSLGIVLYEMLTLERLFLGESDFDTLEKIRKVEMSPPSLYNPHIPKELEDIVLKALARSPDDRFQTSFEFADALERYMRNQGYYYTNKDLAQYMKEAFNADIEFESKKGEYYRSLNLKPLEQAALTTPKVNHTPSRTADSGLSWGEEEMETQIFDRMDGGELDDADIVYSGNANTTDEVPTVEYDRWQNEGFSFNEEPPRPQRGKQPTAQLPAIEPRRAPSHTVPGARPIQRKKKVSIPIVLVVSMICVVVGIFVMQKLLKAELQIETEPKSVEIWINGVKEHDGDTPFSKSLPLGETTIELKREGYVPIKLTQNLESKPYRLNEALSALEHTYSLLVKSDPPGAKIEVNGKLIDEVTPFTVKDLKVGKAALKVARAGFFPETREVDLKDGAADSVDVRLRPEKVSLKITSVPDRAEYALYAKGSSEKLTQGRTPDTVKDLDASKTYRVVVERRKYENWEGSFEPSFETEPTLEANLRRTDDTEPVVVSNVTKVIPPRRDPPVEKIEKKDPEVKVEKKDPPKVDEPTGTGILNIASKPVARVYIDNQDTGRYTPLMNFKIKSGKHKISLKNTDFGLDKTYYVDVSAGETKKIINKP